MVRRAGSETGLSSYLSPATYWACYLGHITKVVFLELFIYKREAENSTELTGLFCEN